MSQLAPIDKLMFPDNVRGFVQEKTVGGESYWLFLFDHNSKTLGVWVPTELLNARSEKAPQHAPVEGVCQYDGCAKEATNLASIRNPDSRVETVGCYCAEHAVAVAQSSCPEYVEKCPNCGCWFGVN